MALPSHVVRKLKEILGSDASEAVMTWIDADSTREKMELLRGDVGELRHEMNVGFARIEALIERRSADLMKWSFVFWVSAVTAIAALAGVLK
ncbi:MAG TPA: hypothetical protein VJ867_06840 [Gemmatimonadaceae bacterium]|nr:hypothetical protein [Gemmatimonadaceae bacterium]